MKRALFFVLISISFTGFSQKKAAALNNFVESANRSAGELNSVFSGIVTYYGRLKQFHTARFNAPPRYECGLSPEDYYYSKALAESSVLNDGGVLNSKLKALQSAEGVIDDKCKALDTYHKLQDYKQDNFKQADVLIGELQAAFKAYHDRQNELAVALEAEWKKQATPAGGAATTDQMMKREVARERAFLDRWTFNLNDDIHTGWPIEQLPVSISETEKAIQSFRQIKPSLEYPASTMYGSFQEALGSILSEKRDGLDGYNFEAKQSDRHSNEVYLSLINYFNGMLVSGQTNFVRYAQANGYYGVGTLNYVPMFEVRSTEKKETIAISAFQDISYVPVKVTAQGVPISVATAEVLDNYIELLNEMERSTERLTRSLAMLISDAAYLKGATTYKGKGGLKFNHNDFQIPLSDFQSAMAGSSSSSPAWRKTLNDQSQVLLNILREMDQIASVLETETASKSYEQDGLNHVYQLLEREVFLGNALYDKRERLYSDVRLVSESFAEVNPSGSWTRSYKALLSLVDEEKKQLFKVKSHLNGDDTSVPESDRIDTQLREVISNEFTNLKGIENLGSSNGNDPYTPYESIPGNARTFSESVKNFQRILKSAESRGPYHDYLYLYNVAAGDYNKFAELAKIHVLKTIYEPDLFKMEYPKPTEAKEPGYGRDNQQDQPITISKRGFVVKEEPGPAPDLSSDVPRRSEGRVIHDTIKVTDIIRIETRSSDTVYIEKHDTIYKDGPGEKMMSMDGYASNNLVFLLDVSGSMNTGQKLPLLKKSMLLLLKILRPEDHVSIVVYSGKAKAVLLPTSAKEQEKIKKVIENLKSEGETDGNAGIRLAYKTANGNYIRGGNNRIVLATDGEFPVSEETLSTIAKYSGEDIFLSVFNFGTNAQAAQSLQKLALLGKGNFASITPKNSDVKLIMEAKGKKK